MNREFAELNVSRVANISIGRCQHDDHVDEQGLSTSHLLADD